MKLSEIQSHSISHRINVPFPVQWSEDDVIAVATDKGVQLLNRSALRCNNNLSGMFNYITSTKMMRLACTFLIILFAVVEPTLCSDITDKVFGSATDGMPAAFGDFNSDKYTDLFVLSKDAKTVKILLGSDTEPLLKEDEYLKCTFKDNKVITSVVPGDFDGDAFMDVLVTVRDRGDANEKSGYINQVYIFWGHGDKLNCTHTDKPLFKLYGQPLAVDCNQDMIIDLFGVKVDHDNVKERGFWIFHKNQSQFAYRRMSSSDHGKELKIPHSHAFLDLNNDNYGDLYLTTEDGSAEIWLYNKSINETGDFQYHRTIPPPPGIDILDKNKNHYMGQTIFQDMALEGILNPVVPVCLNAECTENTIFILSDTGDKAHWYNINVHFTQKMSPGCHFPSPDGQMYLETLTLRAGDFNMDGYPDLLATLVCNGQYRVNLLENVECEPSSSSCNGFPRTFALRDDVLSPYNNDTVVGVFYDFYQDGILDVILVHKNQKTVSAFRNSLDYDANFVKVMVLTGSTYDENKPAIFHPLTKKKRIYGTNLPGPTIIYNTTTQEGDPRSAVSTQLPQSAHFSLSLPYTIFGLGRTPNFVDELSVRVYGQKGKWTQLIPNSQMVVIPWPSNDASQWKVQLFVTPSKLIFQSFCALLGTCLLISLIIGGLYWKERKEDHKEKLQEAQKFHFDAM